MTQDLKSLKIMSFREFVDLLNERAQHDVEYQEWLDEDKDYDPDPEDEGILFGS